MMVEETKYYTLVGRGSKEKIIRGGVGDVPVEALRLIADILDIRFCYTLLEICSMFVKIAWELIPPDASEKEKALQLSRMIAEIPYALDHLIYLGVAAVIDDVLIAKLGHKRKG